MDERLMPLPDPNAEEPTVELDESKWKLYRQAQLNADGWQEEADKRKAAIIADLGDATAGVVNDKKVVYYRPTSKWAESRLIKDYPDLTQHYIAPKVRDEFDLLAFRQAHPDIADKYRVRSFRAVAEE